MPRGLTMWMPFFRYSLLLLIHLGTALLASEVSGASVSRDVLTVTGWTSYTLQITASTSNPTKASSTVVDSANWRRVGDSMEISYSYGHTNSAGAGAGSGTYLFSLPSGYSIDSSKILVSTSSIAGGSAGKAVAYVSGVVSGLATGFVWPYDSTHLALAVTDQNSTFGAITDSFGSLSGATASYQFLAAVPISGWSTR